MSPRRRRRARRPPKAKTTKGLERRYIAELFGVLSRLSDALAPFRAELPTLVARGDTTTALDMLDDVRRQLPGRKTAAGIAAKIATATSVQNAQQLNKQLRAVLDLPFDLVSTTVAPEQPNFREDSPKLLDQYIAENVALIVDLPRATLTGIEQAVSRGITANTPHREVARELENRLRIGRNRARLIARDQISKLNGRLAADRNEAVGVKNFIWRTSGDERVRDEHAALEGQTFSFAKGAPGEGLPGEPIGCRCTPEPVIDDLLAGL